MDPEFDRTRDAILEEAFDIPNAELPAFLDRRCGSNPVLRQEVERLLATGSRMSTRFLESDATSWTNSGFEPGQMVGRYRIESVVGYGGMSVVYRALDTGIGRPVALKAVTPRGLPLQKDTKFLSEVRTLGRIRHPNIVQIYDFGEWQGAPYLVMEFLDGKDLADWLTAAPPQPFATRLDVARQMATGLAHVHGSGILHRDIKPANVFVETNGAVKLMDFGIARPDALGKHSTALVGTPGYIAPEQIQGQPATQQSDIYSFGVVLFELFTGVKAFQGNTA